MKLYVYLKDLEIMNLYQIKLLSFFCEIHTVCNSIHYETIFCLIINVNTYWERRLKKTK